MKLISDASKSYNQGIFNYDAINHLYEIGDLVIREGLVYKCIIEPPTVGFDPFTSDYFKPIHDLDNVNGVITDLEDYLNDPLSDRMVSSSILEDIINYYTNSTQEAFELPDNTNLDTVTRMGVYISPSYVTNLPKVLNEYTGFRYLRVFRLSDGKVVQEIYGARYFMNRVTLESIIPGHLPSGWTDWSIIDFSDGDTDAGNIHESYLTHFNGCISTINETYSTITQTLPKTKVVIVNDDNDLNELINTRGKLATIVLSEGNNQYSLSYVLDGTWGFKKNNSDRVLSYIIYE